MLAGRRSTVEALNRLARQRLRTEGGLGTEEVAPGERAFAWGDTVIAGRNDYRLGLPNGSRGTVTAVDTRQVRVTVATNEGRTVDVPARYLAAGHLSHGYATTVHKAQGATVDTGLLLVERPVVPGGRLHRPAPGPDRQPGLRHQPPHPTTPTPLSPWRSPGTA